jgi:hypothetical protein
MRRVAEGASHIDDALRRLATVLPSLAPDLWATFRTPVTDHDLAELREAVRPHELPGAVVSFLRWADGQEPGSIWWPSLQCGPLLSASRAAHHYRFLCADAEGQWNPLWLPVASEGWYQAGVEMTMDRPGVVLDGSFPDPEVHVVAPSLAAALLAVADMAAEGIVADAPGYASDCDLRSFREATVEARNDREGWGNWPHDRVIALDPAGWPPHWRTAAGLPPDTDYPHPPARPIAEVLQEARERTVDATVEGLVAQRLGIDGDRGILLEDKTGTMRLRVPRDTPGAYWAAWPGRRIQIDVRIGPLASAQAVDSLANHETIEVRMAVQI